MRILNVRHEPPGGQVAAYFDLELNDDVRLYGFTLRRVRGGLLAFPPQDRHARHAAASFSPALIRSIRELAISSIEGGTSLDDQNRAA